MICSNEIMDILHSAAYFLVEKWNVIREIYLRNRFYYCMYFNKTLSALLPSRNLTDKWAKKPICLSKDFFIPCLFILNAVLIFSTLKARAKLQKILNKHLKSIANLFLHLQILENEFVIVYRIYIFC